MHNRNFSCSIDVSVYDLSQIVTAIEGMADIFYQLEKTSVHWMQQEKCKKMVQYLENKSSELKTIKKKKREPFDIIEISFEFNLE